VLAVSGATRESRYQTVISAPRALAIPREASAVKLPLGLFSPKPRSPRVDSMRSINPSVQMEKRDASPARTEAGYGGQSSVRDSAGAAEAPAPFARGLLQDGPRLPAPDLCVPANEAAKSSAGFSPPDRATGDGDDDAASATHMLDVMRSLMKMASSGRGVAQQLSESALEVAGLTAQVALLRAQLERERADAKALAAESQTRYAIELLARQVEVERARSEAKTQTVELQAHFAAEHRALREEGDRVIQLERERVAELRSKLDESTGALAFVKRQLDRTVLRPRYTLLQQMLLENEIGGCARWQLQMKRFGEFGLDGLFPRTMLRQLAAVCS
jgi:hypothetical protein